MKKLEPNQGLRIFDIKWDVKTAGPSPNDNSRIEVFLLGCDKAMNGNPCKGCFNDITWDKSKAKWSWDPIELADMINDKCYPDNKYITIGGGEPTDQLEYLLPFVHRLKKHGFHIIMYTWKELNLIIKPCFSMYYSKKVEIKIKEIMKYIDILIDGEYKQDLKLYSQDYEDGMINSIGSGNQIIWDCKHMREHGELINYSMSELVSIYIKSKNNDLVYILKDGRV